MMIVPVPTGDWGLGPSLLYLLGIVIGIPAIDWWYRREEKKRMGPSPEEVLERRKDDAFTRALINAASGKGQ